jgi:hypothetical protein
MIEPTVPSIDAGNVVLTGRRRAGKDWVAEKNGYTILGFADPMYTLAEHFIGSSDKEDPGVLEFIFKLGAWGRGEVSERYPLGPERGRITEEIRNCGWGITDIPGAWQDFGRAEGFWIGVLEKRVKERMKGGLEGIAIPNARFPEEISRFTDNHDFQHRHVMCSEETRRMRLLSEEYHGPSDQVGPGYAEDLPKTEQLAAWLDRFAKMGKAAAASRFSPHMLPGDPDFPMESRSGDTVYLSEELSWRAAEGVAGRRNVVWNDPDKSAEDVLGSPNGGGQKGGGQTDDLKVIDLGYTQGHGTHIKSGQRPLGSSSN